MLGSWIVFVKFGFSQSSRVRRVLSRHLPQKWSNERNEEIPGSDLENPVEVAQVFITLFELIN